MAFRMVQIVAADRKVIFEGLVCFLPVDEQVLRQRCLDYYHKEVCAVRKESMRRVMYLEIEDALAGQSACEAGDGMRRLPDPVKGMLAYKEKDLFYKIVQKAAAVTTAK